MDKKTKKKRYIIEITYADDKGTEVESLDISTDDLQWSMEQYKRNRPPLEWRVVHEYGSGI